MSYDNESAAAAVRRESARGWVVLAVGTAIVVTVLIEGISLYGHLPDEILVAGKGSSVPHLTTRNVWDAFFMLVFGAAWMVLAFLTEARRPRLHSWPQWSRLEALSALQREYVLSPYREGWRLGGAVMAVAFALTQHCIWHAWMAGDVGSESAFLGAAGMLSVIAIVGAGGVVSSRRLRALAVNGEM